MRTCRMANSRHYASLAPAGDSKGLRMAKGAAPDMHAHKLQHVGDLDAVGLFWTYTRYTRAIFFSRHVFLHFCCTWQKERDFCRSWFSAGVLIDELWLAVWSHSLSFPSLLPWVQAGSMVINSTTLELLNISYIAKYFINSDTFLTVAILVKGGQTWDYTK